MGIVPLRPHPELLARHGLHGRSAALHAPLHRGHSEALVHLLRLPKLHHRLVAHCDRRYLGRASQPPSRQARALQGGSRPQHASEEARIHRRPDDPWTVPGPLHWHHWRLQQARRTCHLGRDHKLRHCHRRRHGRLPEGLWHLCQLLHGHHRGWQGAHAESRFHWPRVVSRRQRRHGLWRDRNAHYRHPSHAGNPPRLLRSPRQPHLAHARPRCTSVHHPALRCLLQREHPEVIHRQSGVHDHQPLYLFCLRCGVHPARHIHRHRPPGVYDDHLARHPRPARWRHHLPGVSEPEPPPHRSRPRRLRHLLPPRP